MLIRPNHDVRQISGNNPRKNETEVVKEKVEFDIFDLEVEVLEGSGPTITQYPSGSCTCSQGCSGGCYSNHTNCK